jgi:hypothetical protein
MDNIKESSERVEKQKDPLDVKQHAFLQGEKANEDNTANDLEQQKAVLKRNLNHIKLPFPWKVQEMLANVEKEGSSHIVAWMPHGKSFRVHSQEDFVKSIMPSYFNQTKFTSFTRQLYMYGFQKVQDGSDKGAFFHSQFVKENKSLCLTMGRKKDKPSLHPYYNNTSAFPSHQSRAMTYDHAPEQSGILSRPDVGSNHQGHHGAGMSSEVEQEGSGSMLPQIAPMSMPPSPQPTALLSPFQSFAHDPRGLSRRQHERNFEEEDWLAKFERLTSQAATDQMLLGRPLDCVNIPSLAYISQARSENMLQAPSRTFESINSAAVLPTNTIPRLQPSINAREEERIHPRMVNTMNVTPDIQQRNAQQDCKYVDPFADHNEEADADGFPFFVDPF